MLQTCVNVKTFVVALEELKTKGEGREEEVDKGHRQ